ncbi:hypothetical protein JG687_00006414 [Phytophthora cactorum]|uniref:RxLR effector protein n=1 Tax=Phytophthora cactorum TaxID=29920 RepID=A0A329S3P7_9STRA|nr:hypothetical protein Pcac1_g18021 [Phytophthora cactorum]KAG2808523.1 hypothetical protein PC112_g16925 [Phytophthora cactorum]KAG2829356.1 hypothetical protein PC111_g7798 [Phytophthora cactorum]KAG2850226.1 hypothetical protein PC113_g16975 [Phytophthora cactorum]KAG2888182.1 hypothetical protein PC114_g18496 [Phytophthora cactorum]
MRVSSLMLAMAAAILVAVSNAASVTRSSTPAKQTTLNFMSSSRVLESNQNDKIKGRFLRSGATGGDEDRALNNNAFL